MPQPIVSGQMSKPSAVRSSERFTQCAHIKRVEVGVYEVRGLRKGFDEPARLSVDDFAKAWEPLVQVREDGEHVFVLFQEKQESIRRMLIVVTEDEEWVIVRLKGNLDLILEESMRMAFDEIDRPSCTTGRSRSGASTRLPEDRSTRNTEPRSATIGRSRQTVRTTTETTRLPSGPDRPAPLWRASGP